MKNIALKYAIVKLNIIMFTILIFGLYKHLIIASTMIIIAGLDIILAFFRTANSTKRKSEIHPCFTNTFSYNFNSNYNWSRKRPF